MRRQSRIATDCALLRKAPRFMGTLASLRISCPDGRLCPGRKLRLQIPPNPSVASPPMVMQGGSRLSCTLLPAGPESYRVSGNGLIHVGKINPAIATFSWPPLASDHLVESRPLHLEYTGTGMLTQIGSEGTASTPLILTTHGSHPFLQAVTMTVMTSPARPSIDHRIRFLLMVSPSHMTSMLPGHSTRRATHDNLAPTGPGTFAIAQLPASPLQIHVGARNRGRTLGFQGRVDPHRVTRDSPKSRPDARRSGACRNAVIY